MGKSGRHAAKKRYSKNTLPTKKETPQLNETSSGTPAEQTMEWRRTKPRQTKSWSMRNKQGKGKSTRPKCMSFAREEGKMTHSNATGMIYHSHTKPKRKSSQREPHDLPERGRREDPLQRNGRNMRVTTHRRANVDSENATIPAHEGDANNHSIATANVADDKTTAHSRREAQNRQRKRTTHEDRWRKEPILMVPEPPQVENREQNAKHVIGERDPSTLETKSQGRDPRTHETNSQGRDPNTQHLTARNGN